MIIPLEVVKSMASECEGYSFARVDPCIEEDQRLHYHVTYYVSLIDALLDDDDFDD